MLPQPSEREDVRRISVAQEGAARIDGHRIEVDQIGGRGKAVSADDHDGVRNIKGMELVFETMDLGGVDDCSDGRTIAHNAGAMFGRGHHELAIRVVVEPGFDLADAISRCRCHG